MKVYELPNVGDSRKSFYGKAQVIEQENGEIILQSYDTQVCKLDKDGNFVRLWWGYSGTTMRHVNSFVRFFDVKGVNGGKKWWDSLKVGEV